MPTPGATCSRKAGPFGAGGRVIGSETCEWFPGKMFLVCRSDGTGPMGELHGLAILGHDASQRKYTYYSISNSAGESETATGVKRPDGWTWTSEVKFGD